MIAGFCSSRIREVLAFEGIFRVGIKTGFEELSPSLNLSPDKWWSRSKRLLKMLLRLIPEFLIDVNRKVSGI